MIVFIRSCIAYWTGQNIKMICPVTEGKLTSELRSNNTEFTFKKHLSK